MAPWPRGRVDEALEHQLISHPYFKALPPKSLDRHAFRLRVQDAAEPGPGLDRLSLEDGAATSPPSRPRRWRAPAHFPEEPQQIVSGGGRRNRTLMRMIAARVQNAVVPVEAARSRRRQPGSGAWAYLAVRACKRLPITFPAPPEWRSRLLVASKGSLAAGPHSTPHRPQVAHDVLSARVRRASVA